jgi:tetratricopeptide (TPR) repeat protein
MKVIGIYDEEASPTEKIHLRVSYAQVFQEEGKYAQAIELYTQAIELGSEIENRSYYIEELLARSFEGRGKCRWKLNQFEAGIEDIYHAIDGYIQINQYNEAYKIFKEYESVYTSVLKFQRPPKYLIKAGIDFMNKTLPLIEINADKFEEIKNLDDFLGKRYTFIALGYRKIGDFYNAGRMFQKAGDKFRTENPLRAVINFLEAGECYQKAKQTNYAYTAYIEVKNILLPLQDSEKLQEIVTNLQSPPHRLALLNLMLKFLEDNFPKAERTFIRKLKNWLGNTLQKINMQSP